MMWTGRTGRTKANVKGLGTPPIGARYWQLVDVPTAASNIRFAPPRHFVCPSSVRMVVRVLRSTSKITAVDQPNNSTPFIAVIGPSKWPARHRRDVAVTERRVVYNGEINERDSGGARRYFDPNVTSIVRGHQKRHDRGHDGNQSERPPSKMHEWQCCKN
jgi:hypothetical protein